MTFEMHEILFACFLVGWTCFFLGHELGSKFNKRWKASIRELEEWYKEAQAEIEQKQKGADDG